MLNGQLPESPGGSGGLRRPLSRVGPGLRPLAQRPPLPQPQSFAFQAPRRIWRLLPRPPGDRRGEDTCFTGARGRGLCLGWAAPGSAWPEAVPSPQRPPLGVPGAGPLPERDSRSPCGRGSLGHWHLQRELQGDQSPKGMGQPGWWPPGTRPSRVQQPFQNFSRASGSRLLSPWKSSLGRPEFHAPVASEAGQEPGWG